MSVPRVYVPATLELLPQWHESGVVPGIEEGFEPEDDSEEAEYTALMNAADASTELAGRDRRRVVVVLEVGDESGNGSLSEVVALHVDDKPRAPTADPDDDLSWYAAQELEDLLQ